MPVESLLDDLERQNKAIEAVAGERRETIKRLRAALLQNNDWVSVRRAADFADISQSKIYERINDGRLQCKHIGAKKYVLLSEIKAIDDKYGA